MNTFKNVLAMAENLYLKHIYDIQNDDDYVFWANDLAFVRVYVHIFGNGATMYSIESLVSGTIKHYYDLYDASLVLNSLEVL